MARTNRCGSPLRSVPLRSGLLGRNAVQAAFICTYRSSHSLHLRMYLHQLDPQYQLSIREAANSLKRAFLKI